MEGKEEEALSPGNVVFSFSLVCKAASFSLWLGFFNFVHVIRSSDCKTEVFLCCPVCPLDFGRQSFNRFYFSLSHSVCVIVFRGGTWIVVLMLASLLLGLLLISIPPICRFLVFNANFGFLSSKLLLPIWELKYVIVVCWYVLVYAETLFL